MTLPSLLIVDDEPDNFDVIEALLPSQGYVLHYAPSGETAIAALDMFRPDVILLDVMMPGLDGMQVCERIKAMPQWQFVPIIMVTALTSKEDLAHCLKAGADDFISKPVNGIELRARVHSMLRIKQQRDSLEALLQLREEMVNMVVHDLRNPVTNILFALDILDTMDLPREAQKAKIAQARFSGKQLRLLIDDLLIMAKIEQGRLQLNYTAVDLAGLITSLETSYQLILDQKRLTLITQLPKRVGWIMADAALFYRVLDNLVANAVKFSPKGGKIIVQADVLDRGGTKIQVSDEGPGVSPDLRERIFEKYEVGTLMEGVSQIGLGLAFSKMIVEAHHGEICVRDNTPKGAIFEITLSA